MTGDDRWIFGDATYSGDSPKPVNPPVIPPLNPDDIGSLKRFVSNGVAFPTAKLAALYTQSSEEIFLARLDMASARYAQGYVDRNPDGDWVAVYTQRKLLFSARYFRLLAHQEYAVGVANENTGVPQHV